jgi:hypothetical protein
MDPGMVNISTRRYGTDQYEISVLQDELDFEILVQASFNG